MGSLESDTTEWLHFHFSLSCIGEGNGNPLQCSCLENPRDRGAWWAAVYGVAQSWTWLKRLSSSSSSSICSILFSRFLIIFTIIILNSFSDSLLISFFVFLVCSFIGVVFLCLFIIFFLTYCVWGLLFPGFKVELFLPFGFCLPKIGPVVCVSFV